MATLSAIIEKADRFKALHQRDKAFVIPNPWDVGTTKILENMGFEALATTGAGIAFSMGRPDGEGAVSRDEAIEQAKMIVDATTLPVSADLENGFGPRPKDAAMTIKAAGEIGLVGGSIEDATGDHNDPIYGPSQALEKVIAAVEAARALPFHFTLTARAENFLYGRKDLDDTIKRLKSFEEAGADVLYAPGLSSLEDIKAVCSALEKPVNVVMGLVGAAYSMDALSAVGVKRVSVGSSFARAAMGGFIRAAQETLEQGTFTFADQATPYGEINKMMKKKIV